MDDDTRRKLRNRLRRAHGQLAGVERMLGESDDCVALLTQLAAVEGALAKTRAVLLQHHVETCVADALDTGNRPKRSAIVNELMDVIGRQLGDRPMSNAHNHNHDHVPRGKGAARRLAIALALAASYLGAEVVGGLWTGSLALLADAGHMLGDVAALALALFATWLATRPATAERTFGYHRAEVLAAFANALALLVIGAFVIAEGIKRVQAPPEVLAGPMLAIATGGLIVNLIALLILRSGQRESMNVRGAFLHVMADALGSLGAMTSGALIWAFDWRWADPAASLFIGTLVILSALGLLRQTVRVLMQATPSHLDVKEIQELMTATDGVASVHDVHAWTLASGRELLSAHVVIEDPALWMGVLAALRATLRNECQLEHVTLQPELPSTHGCGCTFR